MGLQSSLLKKALQSVPIILPRKTCEISNSQRRHSFAVGYRGTPPSRPTSFKHPLPLNRKNSSVNSELYLFVRDPLWPRHYWIVEEPPRFACVRVRVRVCVCVCVYDVEGRDKCEFGKLCSDRSLRI